MPTVHTTKGKKPKDDLPENRVASPEEAVTALAKPKAPNIKFPDQPSVTPETPPTVSQVIHKTHVEGDDTLIGKSFDEIEGKKGPTRESFADKWGRIQSRRATILNLSREAGDQLDTEQAYRIGRITSKTQLPEDFVIANLEELEREAAEEAFDAERFQRESPLVSNWIMQHPNHSGMSKEEVFKLGNIEKFFSRPKVQWPKSEQLIQQQAEEAGLRQTIDFFNPFKPGQDISVEPTEGQFQSVLKANIEREVKRRTEIERFIASDEEIGGFETVGRRFDENPVFFLPFISAAPDISRVTEVFIAAKAVEKGSATDEQKMLLMDYARIASAAERRGLDLWGMTASVITEIPALGGEMYLTAGVFSSAKGIALNTVKKASEGFLRRAVAKLLGGKVRASIAATAVQASVATPQRVVRETIQRMTPSGQVAVLENGDFEFKINPGSEQAFTTALPKAIVSSFVEFATEKLGGTKLFKAIDKGSAIVVNKLVFDWWAKKHAGATVKGFQQFINKAGVHGVLSEMGEEEISKLVTTTLNSEEYHATTLQELKAQAIAFSFLPFTGAVVGQFGPKIVKTNPEEFEALGKQMEQLKMAQEVPGVVEQLVKEFGTSHNKETVFAPVDSFSQHFQSKGIDPRDAAREIMGDTKAFDEAVENGTDIEIPVEKYAVNIAPTEDNAFFKEEVKYDPLESNTQETLDLINEEIKRIQLRNEIEAPLNESAQQVHDNVTEQLKAAGVEENVANFYSHLYGSAFRNLGERGGVDPLELYERYNLRIQKGQSPIVGERKTFAPEEITAINTRERNDFLAEIQAFEADDTKAVKKLLVEQGIGKREANKLIRNSTIEVGTRKSKATPDEVRLARNKILRAIGSQKFFQTQDERIGDLEGTKSMLGQIMIGRDTRNVTIELFEEWDRSTFIHETGHFFLEIMKDMSIAPEAGPQIKEDLDSVLKWLGVDRVDQIGEKEHEQFARGFEAYLREGKAPSSALQMAFRSFKRWLTRIYSSLRELDVKLNKDIREVFDRMIATDEEIESAASQLNINLSFADPAKIEDVKDTAKETMMKKLMSELRRDERQQFREEKQRITAQVIQDVDNTPVYKVENALKGGEVMSDGTPLKLQSESIIVEYGGAERLAKFKGMTEKGGMAPDLVADLYGFASGQDLLQALENAPPKKDVIENLVNTQLEIIEPTIFSSEQEMEETAREELHNERRVDLLMQEMKEIAKRTKQDAPTKKAIRLNAKQFILKKSRSELRPNVYLNAQARAAKEAFEATARGELLEAYRATLREILNHELFRAATLAKEEFDKTIKTFGKNLFKKDKVLAKTRDMNMVNAARAILANYEIGKSEKSAADWLEPMKKYGDPEQIETLTEIVKNASGKPADIRDITLSKFQTVKTIVEALWETSRRNKQVTIDGKKIALKDVVDDLVARIDDIKPIDKSKINRTTKKSDLTNVKLLGYLAGLVRVESWTETMDGGKSDGFFTKYLSTPIREGIDTFRTEKNKVLKKFTEFQREIKDGMTFNKIVAEELNGFVFSQGKSDIMGALLHTGNKSNLRKLLLGYEGWGDVDAEGNLDSAAWDAFIKRMVFEGVLTKKDFEFVQKTWNLLEELKPDTQKAHFDMYGFHFDEIVADEFEVDFPDGSKIKYKGGYFPAKTDPLKVSSANNADQMTEMERNGRVYAFPTTGKGATLTRDEYYTKPLSLRIALAGTHIDWALRFTYIEPRVKDVMRTIKNPEFRERLNQFNPTIIDGALIPWLKRAASQRSEQARDAEDNTFWHGLDSVARVVKRRVGLALMTGNIKNVMEQFGGFFISATRIPPKHLRNALFEYMKAPRAMSKNVRSRSEFMENLTDDQMFDAVEAMDEIMFETSKLKKAENFFRKHGLFMQKFTQGIVNTITWQASYENSIENKLSEKEAVRIANKDVRLTQGDFGAESMSKFESGTPTAKMFTQFQGFFNMQANLLASEYIKTFREMGLKKGAGRLTYITLTAFTSVALVNELINKLFNGKFDEDDDDQYLDDVAQMFFWGHVSNATAMTPYAGPFIESGINEFNDKWYDDDISLSPAISVFESSKGVYQSISSAAKGTGKRSKAIKDSLMLLSLITGIPFSAVSRPAAFLSDVEEGIADPEDVLDFTRGIISGRPGSR